jgi:DNA polymerase III sliding clamp (beta) subunit (PCNA family)
MKANLSKTVRDLANGASTDDERPILTGVKFTEREAIVADGNILVVKQLPQLGMDLDNTPDDNIKQVVIPADAIKACKGETVIMQTIESLKSAPLVELLNDKATTPITKIVARMSGDDFNVEADSIDGNYPDYNGLFNESPLVGQVAINTKILKKLIKVLPDESMLILRISEPDKAIEFQCSDPDGDMPIRGIVMPMNFSGLHTIWKTKNTDKVTPTDDKSQTE